DYYCQVYDDSAVF
nr:immunoglobulin light chain junction region [Macaca mulatta]